jgi:hypothetical protein
LIFEGKKVFPTKFHFICFNEFLPGVRNTFVVFFLFFHLALKFEIKVFIIINKRFKWKDELILFRVPSVGITVTDYTIIIIGCFDLTFFSNIFDGEFTGWRVHNFFRLFHWSYKAKTTNTTLSIRSKIYVFSYELWTLCGIRCFCLVLQKYW